MFSAFHAEGTVPGLDSRRLPVEPDTRLTLRLAVAKLVYPIVTAVLSLRHTPTPPSTAAHANTTCNPEVDPQHLRVLPNAVMCHTQAVLRADP